MTDSQASDFSSAARRIGTYLRLEYIREYLNVGAIDLAIDTLKQIDPADSKEAEVIVVRKELERIRAKKI
jgi:hypothetical protein